MVSNIEKEPTPNLPERGSILNTIRQDIEQNPSVHFVGETSYKLAVSQFPWTMIDHKRLFVAPTDPLDIHDAEGMNAFTLGLTKVDHDEFAGLTGKRFKLSGTWDPEEASLELAKLNFKEIIGSYESGDVRKVKIFNMEAFEEDEFIDENPAGWDLSKIHESPIVRRITIVPYPLQELARIMFQYDQGLNDGSITHVPDGKEQQFERLRYSLKLRDLRDLQSGLLQRYLDSFRDPILRNTLRTPDR